LFLDVRTALLQGTKLLEESAVDTPRLTAEVLLAHAIGCRREWLFAHATDELKELWWIHYGRYLHQRMGGMPTQYITGKQEFLGREFRVTPDVLIPRPETEHLVEAALARLKPGDRVADIGTGSGAIAISISLEAGIPVIAADLSGGALDVARANAEALGATVWFVQGDLLEPFGDRSLHLIASNPPYIPLSEGEGLQREVRDFEPHLALFGGEDGMVNYRRLVASSERVLQPGGWLLMELAYNASDQVSRLFGDRWTDLSLVDDLAGYPRVIAARLRLQNS
jgi:release factor glutamine methyltransferase